MSKNRHKHKLCIRNEFHYLPISERHYLSIHKQKIISCGSTFNQGKLETVFQNFLSHDINWLVFLTFLVWSLCKTSITERLYLPIPHCAILKESGFIIHPPLSFNGQAYWMPLISECLPKFHPVNTRTTTDFA